jgi:hypothetical protein
MNAVTWGPFPPPNPFSRLFEGYALNLPFAQTCLNGGVILLIQQAVFNGNLQSVGFEPVG